MLGIVTPKGAGALTGGGMVVPTRGLGGAGNTGLTGVNIGPGNGAEGFEAPGALGPLKPQAPTSLGETDGATA